MDAERQPFLSHLVELRRRLLHCVLVLLLVFICLSPFAPDLYSLFALPLLQRSEALEPMIAIGIITPFLVPLKLAFLVAVFVCAPYILFQGWAFITPALYKRERRFFLPLVTSSILLFYLGVAFTYFIFLPLLFDFLKLFELEGMRSSPDIALYLDFCTNMFIAFGLAFETPIVSFLLVTTKICSVEKLRSMRPMVLLAALVVGMLLTPPDVVSQLMFALPVWLLFESGLWVASLRSTNTESHSHQDRK